VRFLACGAGYRLLSNQITLCDRKTNLRLLNRAWRWHIAIEKPANLAASPISQNEAALPEIPVVNGLLLPHSPGEKLAQKLQFGSKMLPGCYG
jgi:hypothetical protein